MAVLVQYTGALPHLSVDALAVPKLMVSLAVFKHELQNLGDISDLNLVLMQNIM